MTLGGLSLAPKFPNYIAHEATTLRPIRGHDLNGSNIESRTRGMI